MSAVVTNERFGSGPATSTFDRLVQYRAIADQARIFGNIPMTGTTRIIAFSQTDFPMLDSFRLVRLGRSPRHSDFS